MIFLILSCYVLVCFLLILVVWWFYDRFAKSEHSLFHHLPRNPIGFFKRIYFNWRIITLQYSDGFCHISTWTGHSHTCVPSLLNLTSHLSPHLIPLGCHRAPALCSLHHASNSHWLFFPLKLNNFDNFLGFLVCCWII